jgi:hypothetical protein
MTTNPTQLRQREILNAQLAQCRQADNSFSRGAVAALSWLTTGGPGPLTGALAAFINFRSIVHELAAAEAIIYGPPSTGREYAGGVEHACYGQTAPHPDLQPPPTTEPCPTARGEHGTMPARAAQLPPPGRCATRRYGRRHW